MASPKSEPPSEPDGIAECSKKARLLFAPDLLFLVWLPVAAITFFHYMTPHEQHWVHDILRRVYYLPIVIAAIWSGKRGGLIVAVVVTLAYLPHAFLASHHYDPARELEKSLEIVLYLLVGAVAGHLSDLECRRRQDLLRALTEQRRLTTQLVRAGRLAALGEVVAGIAHEIKNPLHALRGTAEIVDSLVPKDAEERRMWELHKSEIHRLETVSERFLSFARPAAVTHATLDLRDVAQRLTDLVGAQCRQKGIELTADIPEEAIETPGDLDQLAQVALNIALNAIRAVEPKAGRIHVAVTRRTKDDRTMAVLRIENDGPAIAEEEREHLFDPFHTGGEGTGLGLSISSRIAEQHGGFIEVENGGLGVIFTVMLPVSGTKGT